MPARPSEMGPEGFVAYEYVDDGAFAEPWLAVRPWASSRIWGFGLQSCLGYKALRAKKRMAEGDCSTSMLLWGLNVCTKSETLSLPEDKWHRAQEFLSKSCFDPWGYPY